MSDTHETRVPFRFTGDGTEYFKIWIVNIVLTILTLGIYSAWAKVRNRQYFYGNTHIADSTLVYTADPIRILMGRLIAGGIYGLAILSSHYSQIAAGILFVVLFLVLPWILVKSFKFNARNTQYRNIRFGFNGTVGGAYKYFVGWPLLAILSFGILLPFVWKKQMQFITNNHSYGNEPFNFDAAVGEFYKILFVLIGASVIFVIVAAIIVAIFGGSAAALAGANSKATMIAIIVPIYVLYILFFLASNAYFKATTNNIHFNNTFLKDHRFESNWTMGSYFKLMLVNSLAVLFTLGIFFPWAKVRTAKYKAEHLDLIVAGGLDGFIAATSENTGAIAEGVHDIFDIDISL